MELTVNNISFRAKIGKNILKKINKEFKGDTTKVTKFVRLFEDTFDPSLDKETVVDVNRNRKFVFSNNIFPDIKFQYRSSMRISSSAAKTLINECSKTYGNGERCLFKVIISKYLNKGFDFNSLALEAKKICNPESQKSFNEYIKVAKRIKKEFPKTKFSQEEFDYIQNVIMQEEAETPGTEMYDKIHNLKIHDFSFL